MNWTLPSASSPGRSPPACASAATARERWSRFEDGRYAVTRPVLVAGSRDDVTAYARRRVEGADPDDRAWLQTVVGALAIDVFDANPRVARG